MLWNHHTFIGIYYDYYVGLYFEKFIFILLFLLSYIHKHDIASLDSNAPETIRVDMTAHVNLPTIQNTRTNA